MNLYSKIIVTFSIDDLDGLQNELEQYKLRRPKLPNPFLSPLFPVTGGCLFRVNNMHRLNKLVKIWIWLTASKFLKVRGDIIVDFQLSLKRYTYRYERDYALNCYCYTVSRVFN